MYFFMILVCFASTYGFHLDTGNPQSSGGQNVAKYLTLSEFYDTKTKLQNGIYQTRSETRDLRLDVGNKMSLLTSQLQQMFSAFQQQVTNNGNANENKTLETLEQKYNELLTKHTKLQDNFVAMQKMYVTQGDEILALKNSTREHIKLQDNFDSLQKMHEALETLNQTMKTAVAIQNTAIDSKLQELDKRFNLSLTVVKQAIAKNSEQVAFHARLAKSVTLRGRQTVIFGIEITNIGKAYNPHSGLFKAPYAGLYFFSCTFLKQRSTYLRVQLMKNEVEVQLGHAESSNADAGSMIAVLYLNTGDIVKVRHHPSFGSEQMHGYWSFFTGYLIQ